MPGPARTPHGAAAPPLADAGAARLTVVCSEDSGSGQPSSRDPFFLGLPSYSIRPLLCSCPCELAREPRFLSVVLRQSIPSTHPTINLTSLIISPMPADQQTPGQPRLDPSGRSSPPLQIPANARRSTGSGDCVATAAAVNGTSARRDYVAMAPPPTRPMPPPPPWPMPPPPPGADAKKADSIVGQRSKLFFSLQYRQVGAPSR